MNSCESCGQRRGIGASCPGSGAGVLAKKMSQTTQYAHDVLFGKSEPMMWGEPFEKRQTGLWVPAGAWNSWACREQKNLCCFISGWPCPSPGRHRSRAGVAAGAVPERHPLRRARWECRHGIEIRPWPTFRYLPYSLS